MAISLHLGGWQDLLVLWNEGMPSSGQRFNKIEGKESGNPTKQMTYGEVVSQANRQGDSLGQHCRNGALPWTAIKWWNGASCSRAAWCAWGWGRGQVVWVTDGGIQDCASSWCWTSDSTGTCVASLARQPPLALAELFFCGGITALPQVCPMCCIYRYDGQN